MFLRYGPAEKVSNIGSVVAYCDVTGSTSQISESVVPTVLDTDGNEMDTTGLEISESTVTVTVQFANVKTVPIVLESTAAGEGVTINKVAISPSQLEIIGGASVLNSVSQIIIPSSAINVGDLTADLETEVDVSSYLPEGVSVDSSTSTKVVVSIDVTVEKSVTLDVPSSNIKFEGLNEALSASVTGATIPVTVSGEESVINALKAADITGTIDASEITAAGTYELPVVFVSNDSYSLSASNVSVTVTLAKHGTTSNTSNDSN